MPVAIRSLSARFGCGNDVENRQEPRPFDRGEVILVGAVMNRPHRRQYEFA